ncbi:MAG TPA: hypothetical protein VGJ57_04285 [Nitrospirales bacterium]|jgi:hypothetical protein
MLEMMLAALFLVENPDSGPDCFVSGEIYSSQKEITATLAPTNCPIDIHQQGRMIIMTSPKWVVQVIIPEDIGKQEFVYQWGQSDARIGNRSVQVSYKPAGGASAGSSGRLGS